MSCIELPKMAPQNINILKSYNPVVPAVQGQFKLDITDTFKFIWAGSRGLVVERPIHNLEVAGSNLGEEGGDGKVDWSARGQTSKGMQVWGNSFFDGINDQSGTLKDT